MNIVAIDNPLDFENETYKAVWKTDTLEELQKFSHWLKPVTTDHCMTENPHILTMTDRVAEKKSVTAAMGQMLLPNLHSYSLEADGRDGRITVDFGKEISGFLNLMWTRRRAWKSTWTLPSAAGNIIWNFHRI